MYKPKRSIEQRRTSIGVMRRSHSGTSGGKFGIRNPSDVGEDLVRFKMACE